MHDHKTITLLHVVIRNTWFFWLIFQDGQSMVLQRWYTLAHVCALKLPGYPQVMGGDSGWYVWIPHLAAFFHLEPFRFHTVIVHLTLKCINDRFHISFLSWLDSVEVETKDKASECLVNHCNRSKVIHLYAMSCAVRSNENWSLPRLKEIAWTTPKSHTDWQGSRTSRLNIIRLCAPNLTGRGSDPKSAH